QQNYKPINNGETSLVRLYANNGGVPGALLETNPSLDYYSGSFINVPSGEYFIRYGLSGVLPRRHSVLRPDAGSNSHHNPERYIFAPVTVEPFTQVAFTTTSIFCDASNPNSGILSIVTTGTPIGFLDYRLWPASADPESDTPLVEYHTTDLTETTYTFTGLAAGSYIARVYTDCGYTEQTITMVMGTPTIPEPVASPPVVCAGEETTLSISLPTSLFDIEWFDGDGLSLGTGNIITVSPLVETTYTVKYTLNASFGCSDPTSGSYDITVGVHPELGEDDIDLQTQCQPDGSYRLVATV